MEKRAVKDKPKASTRVAVNEHGTSRLDKDEGTWDQISKPKEIERHHGG